MSTVLNTFLIYHPNDSSLGLQYAYHNSRPSMQCEWYDYSPTMNYIVQESTCLAEDVVWCKWVEMHGQKRAEKGWSRETLGKGHFYPVNYKLYFRLPTCSAKNTISWFAIRRSIRVPMKTHTFIKHPCSFLMPTSLACLGFGGGNHDGSSSRLRALDLNVGAFYYWKRTIKNNIYSNKPPKTSSLSQKYNIKWSIIFLCFPPISISHFYMTF